MQDYHQIFLPSRPTCTSVMEDIVDSYKDYKKNKVQFFAVESRQPAKFGKQITTTHCVLVTAE